MRTAGPSPHCLSTACEELTTGTARRQAPDARPLCIAGQVENEIGDPNPNVPIVFLRSAEIENAYLEVLRLMGQVMRMWLGG